MKDSKFLGVIEGFYGKPWSHADRLSCIELMSEYEVNTLMVATKDEPWQRYDWKSLYSDDLIKQFEELVTVARQSNIHIGVAVSPGLTAEYSNPETQSAIMNRFRQLAKCGIRVFGLLFDDISPVLMYENDKSKYTNLAAAQNELTIQVAMQISAEFPDAVLLVCPVVYYGFGNEVFLAEFSLNLPSNVKLFWTGRQVCSAYLHSSDADIFAKTTNRMPLYWDNFPVNDVEMTHELHIGPYRNREVNLLQHSSGVLVNPMDSFAASRIPLRTVFAYLSDPTGYDADAQWLAALEREFHDETERDSFRKFGLCVYDSCLNPAGASEFDAEIARAIFDYRTGEVVSSLTRLQSLGDSILASAEHLNDKSFSKPILHAYIAPWVDKYKEIGLSILEIRKQLDHFSNDISKFSTQSLQNYLESLMSNPYRVTGDTIGLVLRETIEELNYRKVN